MIHGRILMQHWVKFTQYFVIFDQLTAAIPPPMLGKLLLTLGIMYQYYSNCHCIVIQILYRKLNFVCIVWYILCSFCYRQFIKLNIIYFWEVIILYYLVTILHSCIYVNLLLLLQENWKVNKFPVEGETNGKNIIHIKFWYSLRTNVSKTFFSDS